MVGTLKQKTFRLSRTEKEEEEEPFRLIIKEYLLVNPPVTVTANELWNDRSLTNHHQLIVDLIANPTFIETSDTLIPGGVDKIGDRWGGESSAALNQSDARCRRRRRRRCRQIRSHSV